MVCKFNQIIHAILFLCSAFLALHSSLLSAFTISTFSVRRGSACHEPNLVLNSSQERTRPSSQLCERSPGKSFNVAVNNFFKDPVPPAIASKVEVSDEAAQRVMDDGGGIVEYITAPPGSPPVPRPLWLVILASVPTGLLWYGYYKFAVEEELLQMELDEGKEPRGLGGYGTLGPFTYLMVFGALAQFLHIPGGSTLTLMGITFIYATQFLLYDRVNELYREEGLLSEEPLQVWWCLPIFFPFNVIVGVRQVHFLSQYCYRNSGIDPPPSDPVVDFFPFIGAERYTWYELVTTPSMWCSLLKDVQDIPEDKLPGPIAYLIEKGKASEGVKTTAVAK